MPAKKDDLEKIGDVLLDFFKTQRIRDTLDAIHKFGVSGWEKWWQTELALYLASAEQTIAEWDMEHPFDTDKRTRLAQSRMALDIGFRLKRHAKGDWHFVELKQHDDYRQCIDRMCKDAEKIYAARKHSFDGIRVRYVACAGAFLTIKDEQEVLGYLDAALEDFDIDADGVYLEPIGKHHSVLVF
jgi:hypothetical protein